MGNAVRRAAREVEETVEARRNDNATVLVLTEKGITVVPDAGGPLVSWLIER
jgi:hypothetical protein